MILENIKKYIIISFGVIAVIVAIIIVRTSDKGVENEETAKTFTENFIQEVISRGNNENFLISPFSVKYVLYMLEEGASENTYNQISATLNNEKLDSVLNVKNKISTANALFINKIYTDNVKEKYAESVENKFNAEVIYDDFTDINTINNWVYENTYGMVDKVIDKVDLETVISLVNAVAIDVEWQQQFKESLTAKAGFTNLNGEVVTVDMMRETDGADLTYFEGGETVGIIKPYKAYSSNGEKVGLEFIGIMPNNIEDFLKDFSLNTLNEMKENSKSGADYAINLQIPKFDYEYEISDFKKVLQNLGMTDMFNPNLASFNNIASNIDLYVSSAVHKSIIEFTEYGTKAAAVTYMGLDNVGVANKKTINITFNKPFVYIIKEKDSDEILFFGVVYEL